MALDLSELQLHKTTSIDIDPILNIIRLNDETHKAYWHKKYSSYDELKRDFSSINKAWQEECNNKIINAIDK